MQILLDLNDLLVKVKLSFQDNVVSNTTKDSAQQLFINISKFLLPTIPTDPTTIKLAKAVMEAVIPYPQVLLPSISFPQPAMESPIQDSLEQFDWPNSRKDVILDYFSTILPLTCLISPNVSSFLTMQAHAGTC